MGEMMTNRSELEALVWRRMPVDLKVTASGMKFVSVSGKLAPLGSLSNDTLFEVLTRNAAVKAALTALEAA